MSNRLHRGQGLLMGVDGNERGAVLAVDQQHAVQVAQHVLIQARAFLQGFQAVAVMQQGTDLFKAPQQRLIVTKRQFRGQ